MEHEDLKENQFLDYINGARKDYEDQEKKWKLILNICRILKIIVLSVIPIISFLNSHLGVLVCSGFIGILEFLPSYFKCEEKLSVLNEAITKINFEYQMYFYEADEKYKDTDNLNTLVNNVEKIIFDTELKINNNYNSDAYDNIKLNNNS